MYSPEDHPHHQKKKRVGKACDSCRIKKTKCDGKKPCNKCLQDNKICVFTEKKKPKDKSYPSGYVELLETRLDLLTKSFEKIVQLLASNLPFVKDLILQENSELKESELSNLPNLDDVFIPINKVINYLINEENLLKNLPIDWENGALIAANFNKNNIESDSRQFAMHKSNIQDDSKDYIEEKQDDTPEFNPVKQEFDITDNMFLPLNEFPYSSGFVLANSATLNDGFNELSDFESDNNSIYSNPPALKQPSSPSVEGFKPHSLFSHSEELFNHGNSSLTSLTNNLENHRLSSTNVSPSSDEYGSRRSSSILTRSRSPSHQKLKTIGHIHKPIHKEKKPMGFDNDYTLPSDNINIPEFEDKLLDDV